MNTVTNNSQPLAICEGCPYHYLIPVRSGIRGFEEFTIKEYTLVCKHAEACERAYRQGGESQKQTDRV